MGDRVLADRKLFFVTFYQSKKIANSLRATWNPQFIVIVIMFKDFDSFKRRAQFVDDRHPAIFNVKPCDEMLSVNLTLSIFNSFVVKICPKTRPIELILKHFSDSSRAAISDNPRDV